MQTFEPPWPVLSQASRSVLIDLLVHGPTSRADLARQSGLSPASMTRITRPMVNSGLLTENVADRVVRAGRPSLPMDINVNQAHLIGINLTSSEIHLVRTDLRGTLLDIEYLPIASADPNAVVDEIITAVLRHRRRDPSIFAVGISLAGPVSPKSELVRTSPFLGWTDVPLTRMVRAGTGLPTIVENDVRALTAAEHWFGAAAGIDDFVLVTIGTGVGCGIVVDNRLLDGGGGGVGQIGHLPVTENGPLCERGHRGCARSYLSSTSIVRQVVGAGGAPDTTYEMVLTMAAAGDPVALRVVEDAGRALGTVIGTIAAITAPTKVLISGEGVGLVPFVIDIVRAHAAKAQHWTVVPVPVEVVSFTFTEWARGAAVIALRRQIEDAAILDS